MVNRSRAASYSILLVVVLLLAACVAVNVKDVLEMPIAASRLQTAGTLVAVEGVVTVASGALDDGFALQDASGGIYVSRTRGAAVKTGERVRVSGEIILPNKQITIEPKQIDILGSGSVPAPVDIKTGAVGPATEGRLIRVQGKIIGKVEDDQPYGWKIYLDDGSGRLLVFVATATRIDIKPLRAGQLLRVTGFSGRYEQHTEVLPRGAGDVVPVGASVP
jgi:uncharacterized protein YdeI (BOF family)